MKSAWSDHDAEETVARYAGEGVREDLALRLYTTRLLGRNPLLVLHGGGNTSVKTTVTDLLGDDTEVLCVKGSGGTWPKSSRLACRRFVWTRF
jgi:rhamnose utilization protein RhaD (predicted bifunctional aldolase and dehydrogenase)